MSEFEQSATLIKNDLKAHDFNGAIKEFKREVLSLEQRRTSQANGAKMEGEYFAEVIKLGFPDAKLHQNGENLELVFSDPKRRSYNFDWTSFTRENQNKTSHDLTVQEFTPPAELKALTAKVDKTGKPLKGGVQEKEYVSPSNYAISADQNVLQSGKDKTYSSGIDRVNNNDASSRIGVETTDQTIEWNKWAHDIQASLQTAISDDANLMGWMKNKSGSLQFQFTVDKYQHISNVTVLDSGAIDAISNRCRMLIPTIPRSKLEFPRGSKYPSQDINWTLPYGPNIRNAQHFENVPAEHQQTKTYTYGDTYGSSQRNW